MKKIETTETVLVYTYRYIWKTKDEKLCVKYVTGPQEEHAMFQKSIKENESILSCLREYINEVNFAYIGFTEEVKKEKKKEKGEEKNETL